jgi:hypothetical protein
MLLFQPHFQVLQVMSSRQIAATTLAILPTHMGSGDHWPPASN